MLITDVLLSPGSGAFFYDDQAAIRAGATMDGFTYRGAPRTPGFSSIRMPAQCLGIGLVLSDRSVAWGDMMNVQYSGAGGRDPAFDAGDIAGTVQDTVIPRLIGLDPASFRHACDTALAPSGRRLPLAVEYGVSQALLRAAALVHRKPMAEIICDEFDLPIPDRPVPIYAQSGDARDTNVDKMILRRADVLPHGLINSREKFGPAGETFKRFVRSVVRRIEQIGGRDYRPTLHFDVYGWIGLEVGLDPERIADFIVGVGEDAGDHILNIECPADFGSLDRQVDGYRQIVDRLRRKGSQVRVVVDEYCNTLSDVERFARAGAAHVAQIKMPDMGSVADTASAVLICKRHGMGAFVGGSCTETDLSAQVSVHVAVATQADVMLAKPGMGVDEGMSIVGNAQNRLLAELAHRGRTLARPS